MPAGWVAAALAVADSFENYQYQATERYRVGYTDPRQSLGLAAYLPKPLPPNCHACGGPTPRALHRTCWYCKAQIA